MRSSQKNTGNFQERLHQTRERSLKVHTAIGCHNAENHVRQLSSFVDLWVHSGCLIRLFGSQKLDWRRPRQADSSSPGLYYQVWTQKCTPYKLPVLRLCASSNFGVEYSSQVRTLFRMGMELARNVTSQRVIIMKRNCTNDKESATWHAQCSKLSSTLSSLMLPLELLEIEGDIPLGTVISHACFDAQNEPVSWCGPVYQVSRSLLSAAMGRDSGELDLLDLGWTFSQAVALGGKDSWRKNIKDKKFSCFRHV